MKRPSLSLVFGSVCKGGLILLLAGGCSGSGPSADSRSGQPGGAPDSPIRHMEIGVRTNLVVVADGQARADIVVPEDAVPVVRFAASELRTFIAQATGVELPVVAEPVPGRFAIHLGDGDAAREAGVAVEELPRDGFILRTVGADRLVIAGRDDPEKDPERALPAGIWDNLYERATLFGVYDFLERFVGARFYFAGEIGTVVPQTPRLAIPAVDITDAPDFTGARKVSIYLGEWPGGDGRHTPPLQPHRLSDAVR
ncbi:MAG: alpha-glucuronidase family glycosyl hydrolase, partial [Kiritimatiellia bacterium]|nr:alpha-glucuronidase family glycosyl hydrolase [Kiritimatiellia bacterium]